MIQFNLLPDVKQAFIKAQRVKRLVILVSIVVSSFTIFVTVMLFLVVNVYQPTQLNKVTQDINQNTNRLKSIEDLDKILTIQNQLNRLPALHEAKPTTSRIRDYISAITPQQVSYAKIEIDMTTSTLQFTGAADSLKTVNQFVDTLKFTKYKVVTEEKDESGKVVKEIVSEEEKDAFSEVVLDSFGRDDKGASFKVKLKFDTQIFDNKTKIALKVPSIITTRSFTEKPNLNLFQPLSDPEETEGE